MLLNLAVHVLHLVDDGVGDQLALPADPSEVLQRPWALFTVIFLHEHLLHLALMLAMVLVLGVALERTAGSRAVVATYLASGVTGALALVVAASVLDADGRAVGASAAVLGVAGALIALRPTARLAGATSTHWLAAIVVANIALSFSTPTSSAAHLTGVAVGLLASRILRRVARVDAPGS